MIRHAWRGLSVAVVTALALAVPAVASYADTASISSVSPTYAPVGDTVDIFGSGLATTTAVSFNGTAAQFTATDTDVRTTVPAGATSGPIVVTTAGGSPSVPFTVQMPTHATVHRSTGSVTFPGRANISAVLTAAGVPVRGQTGHLERTRLHHGHWAPVQKAKLTSKHGRVHWRVHPHESYAYRVSFDEVPAYLGTTTRRTTVNLHPTVVVHAPAVQPILTNFTVHGRLRPTLAQQGKVTLDQRVAGQWHQLASQRQRHGVFSFPLSLDTAGRYAYRVRRAPSAHLAGARSSVAVVTGVQRTLRDGMSGPDVRALQLRLRQLHYDVGPVNSSFGYDTLHAVVAFQKVQGMSRDGVVGPRVWRRLAHPIRAKLRHPADASSSGVEVDLTKQVVYYAVNGKIRAILDASSGGGYTYTGSNGTQQQAITPTGHYHVIYKYDGWQKAPLGELYRPAYFRDDGYAIHGSNSVPNYPASHGCVRITVPAADRFWTKFVVGMSVWLYH